MKIGTTMCKVNCPELEISNIIELNHRWAYLWYKYDRNYSCGDLIPLSNNLSPGLKSEKENTLMRCWQDNNQIKQLTANGEIRSYDITGYWPTLYEFLKEKGIEILVNPYNETRTP